MIREVAIVTSRYMPKAAAIHYLNVSQGHKSRSRSSEVTVDATPLAYQNHQAVKYVPQFRHISNEPTYIAAAEIENVAKFPKLGMYLENGKSYEKVTRRRNSLDPLAISWFAYRPRLCQQQLSYLLCISSDFNICIFVFCQGHCKRSLSLVCAVCMLQLGSLNLLIMDK